ncbi:MAG: signal peptidase II [Clostridia bacterium]|nr:signal peptidase II [Clostridia bacterium]
MSKNKNILWYILAAAIVAADFAVKRHILAAYSVGERFGGIPAVCDFVYVKNTGAAFSMLSNNTIVLSAVSIVFCIAAAVYWIVKKPQHPMLRLAVTLLFAGALGNAIDRVAYKFVVDFISIKWFEFPVFNVADMAIVGGAIAAVLYVIFFDKENKNGKAKD